jgi:hypothetical protein
VRQGTPGDADERWLECHKVGGERRAEPQRRFIVLQRRRGDCDRYQPVTALTSNTAEVAVRL